MRMVSSPTSKEVTQHELIVNAAEDFYGNDYPEDEIDSDDEYGRDAYRYRNHASDDEQFDQDWSDEDEVSFYGSTRGDRIDVNLYE